MRQDRSVCRAGLSAVPTPPFHLREKMIKYNKSDKIRKQMICYTNKGQDVQL